MVCNTGWSLAENQTCLLNCGNSERDSAEECDDGNLDPDDGCSDECTVENGYRCHDGDFTVSGNPDTCWLLCGDGALDEEGSYKETCDDANTVADDGCSASCEIEDGFECTRENNNADVCALPSVDSKEEALASEGRRSATFTLGAAGVAASAAVIASLFSESINL